MNIFRSLIGKVWQDPNAAEVVKISTGQLYLVRPGNIRSSRECIYNDAMATIRRVPSLEHNFQLVITRVYEDGDQELLEDEDETDEERVFLISEELDFRTGEMDGEPTFLWRDLHGDVDEFYEYVAPGTNEPTRAFFETCMYRAMYERKYKKSADNTQDSDFEEFVWHPPTTKVKPPPRRKVSAKVDPASLTGELEALSVSGDLQPSSSGVEVGEEAEPVVQESAFMASMDICFEQEAELYLWDFEKEDFEHQGVVIARIVQQKDANYRFWLTASVDGKVMLAHPVCSDMNQKWSHQLTSLTWNHLSEDGIPSSWLLRFATEEDFAKVIEAFSRSLWQTLHQTDWSKAKPEEQRYVLSSTEDVEMRDVSDDEEDEDEVFSELDPAEEASDDSEQEEEEDEGNLPPALSKGERNSQLTVGYKGDRSYVVRGNNIGVFNHSSDNSVKYYATISKIATTKGKEFKPKHVMLHDQDTKMVLMNPTDPNSLYSMDIERGKVVEEWKVHDDITVDHIAPDNKFAPTTREQTLVGASHNALFRIDPRVAGMKMVESQYKQYVSKNKFSGVATTAAGKLAVASEKGDIRMFDSIGKNAKTALPPLGDPILGIDVTADGRYIVATTKTYLLLIDTLIGEGRYAGQLGFDRSFPATSKPVPRRLQLRAEHVAYMGHGISFTPARFNQGEGQEENAIVTSTGQFVIAWDFAKVKKGHLDKYEIKKYEDHVVQDNFKFGDDKEIIVALDNNVLAINKKNLKKPTRHSLAAPLTTLQSHSNIVNAPF
ncbi:VID27 cytoplasmic protein-domain-containing protein [Crucibulum laeve]|uniref:VID27 cytoplasmic protein-domain-containing protein n=1 Tax=Crucibulum laeve TaxID=68775 RepID=A0A5C3MFQ0_9AGAR|nr:VID27 cytoplasmic protein-domain-containing protein [Crucibulum laeve]